MILLVSGDDSEDLALSPYFIEVSPQPGSSGSAARIPVKLTHFLLKTMTHTVFLYNYTTESTCTILILTSPGCWLVVYLFAPFSHAPTYSSINFPTIKTQLLFHFGLSRRVFPHRDVSVFWLLLPSDSPGNSHLSETDLLVAHN